MMKHYLPFVAFVCALFGMAAPLHSQDCPAPTGLAATAVTGTSATLTCMPQGSEDNWIVSLNGTAVDTVSSSDDVVDGEGVFHYTLTALSPNTSYTATVTAWCGGTLVSTAASTTFETPCADMVLPFFDDFESYTAGSTALPDCWTRINEFSPGTSSVFPNIYSAGGVWGNVINFNGQGGTATPHRFAVATPHITTALNNLEVSFDTYKYHLYLYAATDLEDDATWTLLGEWNVGYLIANKHVEIHTDSMNAPAAPGWLVFAGIAKSNDYSNAYLDNLAVSALSGCDRTASVLVEAVTPNTATISWEAVEGQEDYVVIYSTEASLANAESVEVSGTSTTIENLQPATLYYVGVQTRCGETQLSEPRTTTLTTQYSCYPVINLRQSGATSNSASFQWDFDVRGNEHSEVVAVIHDLTDTEAEPITEPATGETYHFFTGLDNTHQYEAYFVTVCGEDSSFAIGMPVTFRGCGETMTSLNPQHGINSFPLNTFYNYTYCQMMYPADDFLDMDTIRGLAVHRDTIHNFTPTTRLLSIYMSNSNLDTLVSPLSTTGMTQVVNNGSLVVDSSEWDTILFTTPFVYDGTSNVVITIDDNTSGNTGSNSAWWRFHPTLTGRMFISMADNVNIDPAGPTFPTSGYNTQRNILPDMHFVGICHNDGSCEAPMVAVAAVGETDAEITWFGGTGTEWMVEYRPMGGEQWILADTTDGSPYQLTGLTPGTNYEVRVGVVCTGTDRYSGTATFTTVCAQVSVPFHFTQSEMVAAAEARFSPCWSFSDNFRRGTLSDSHRGYVRNVGNNQWFMLPAVNRPLQGTRFRTWVGVGSDTDMKIGVATQNDCSDVEWLDTITIPGSNVNYGHVEVTYYFDDYEGDARRVVASPIIPTQDAIYVYYFDFHIEVEECRPVADLVLDSTDASTLSISWTPRSQQSQWIVYVGDEVVGTADIPSYTIRNLEAYSPYAVSVRGICSGGDTTAATTATFRTGCTGESCTFSIHCTTTADNGWQGAYIGVAAQTGDDIQDFEVLGSVTMVNANRVVRTFAVCADYPVHFSWSSGNNDLVCTFDIVNEAGDTIYHSQGGKVDSRYPANQENLGPSFYVDSAICPSGVGPEPVGIDETASKTLALYPNPASTSVTLTGMENGAVVTLLDFSGREVMRRSTTGDRMNISLDGLAKGAYFVRVAGKSSVATRKLIVR
ncbi:MAG: fibronectin type III domain-containing protein [Bacteroidales bacterium]|nr:fibronectin type III domain-containing protein [Bacteroidales bacterium]